MHPCYTPRVDSALWHCSQWGYTVGSIGAIGNERRPGPLTHPTTHRRDHI